MTAPKNSYGNVILGGCLVNSVNPAETVKVRQNMHLTQKIRVFPSPKQEDVLWHLSDRCRLLYNFALLERKREWKLRGEMTGYAKQQNDLPAMKERYPEYGWVYSKVLQMVLRTLDADYRSFFSVWSKGRRDAEPPRFKGRMYFMTMNYNQSGFKIERGKITLKHYYNKVPLAFIVPEKYEFERVRQVSIHRDSRDRRFYLSIIYELPERPHVDNGLYQAVDLGINKIVTAVNTLGRFFEVINPRPDKYWNPRVDAICSRRDHCKKRSRKWHRLNNALRRCQRKCSDQLQDHQHKLSREMVSNTKANTIVIGHLAVKEMARSGRTTSGLNRSIHNTGYISRFARFLTYKAKLAGKRIIEIDEYNTSRKCYVCGKEHDMPLSKRTMECDCGNVIDRDRSSAINIMIRFLSQNALWTGYQQFVGNLRNTGLLAIRTEEHSQEAPHLVVR